MTNHGLRLVPNNNLERLIATVEALESVAETATDAQAARVDPLERAWLDGYRQAMKDVHDAHELHRLAYPERSSS